jgi:hypothetical protein
MEIEIKNNAELIGQFRTIHKEIGDNKIAPPLTSPTSSGPSRSVPLSPASRSRRPWVVKPPWCLASCGPTAV